MPEYKSPQSEHGNEQRFVLVFLLMAAVIFGAQLYMKKYGPTTPSTAHPNQPTQAAPSSQPPAPNQAAAASPATAPKRSRGSSAQPSTQQAQSESETVVENDLYRITFTNRGAQAKSWILKKYSDDQGRPLDIVNQAAAAQYGYPLAFWSYDESLRNQLNSVLYVASENGTVLAPTTLIYEYSANG